MSRRLGYNQVAVAERRGSSGSGCSDVCIAIARVSTSGGAGWMDGRWVSESATGSEWMGGRARRRANEWGAMQRERGRSEGVRMAGGVVLVGGGGGGRVVVVVVVVMGMAVLMLVLVFVVAGSVSLVRQRRRRRQGS